MAKLHASFIGIVQRGFMFSHEEMISLQAEKHELVNTTSFNTKEEYVLHLIHSVAYKQAAKSARDKTVLDLGCNMGYGSHIISETCKEIIGVDVSQKAISTAKNFYHQKGIDFQTIDGKRLPFKDSTFDLVVSCQVIEHIVNYQDYIHEIKRVLSPEGLVMFTTPNSLLRLDPGMKPWNLFHIREFSASELNTLLKEFFNEVTIYGLFASDPLYSIEFNRIKRIRENVRNKSNRPPSLYNSLRSLVKTILPDEFYKNLVKIADSLRGAKEPGESKSRLTKSFRENHTTADFFYRTNSLENALDLLAICSTTKKPFNSNRLI